MSATRKQLTTTEMQRLLCLVGGMKLDDFFDLLAILGVKMTIGDAGKTKK